MPASISTPPLSQGWVDGSAAVWEEGGELAPVSPETRRLLVPAGLHGERVDRALAALVPELSRNYLTQLVHDGAVQLDGRLLRKASTRVAAGASLEMELRPTAQANAFQPERMALDVVYEDAHLAVIHKPAGMVVHPAPGNWSGTLMNGLLGRDPQAAVLPRAGIVHRLDKDTSGLMVVARDRPAMDALVAAIAARQVSRRYLALAHRPWEGVPCRDIEQPIGRDPYNRLRMAVVDLGRHAGKGARTTVELRANLALGCWLECALHTGRTHQIRVHLASIGHPLVADGLYGGAPAAGLQRQALHAWRLAFAHPLSGVPLAFEAPIPDDLAQAARAWGVP